MAGEFDRILLKISEGDSVLVEGGSDSGKEFFCRLLLRQALDGNHPVAVLSTRPEAHLAWFRKFSPANLGKIRYSEAPDSLTELGISLTEQAKECRFAYIDFFDMLFAKFEANDILDALAFNAKKLKAGKTSLLQTTDPASVDAKQMSRLRDLFDIVIEVRRNGDKMEYRYRHHPTEFDAEWHGFMAKSEKYSIDEMLKEYSERKTRRAESRYAREAPAEAEEPEEEERRMEPAPKKKAEEQEYYEKPERIGEPLSESEKLPKRMVRSKPLMLFTYALRSLAISVMLMLMLFVILHDVMKKKPLIDYFSQVGDSFTAFLSTYITAFTIVFLSTFGLQAIYYLVHRVATGKWKAYPREAMVYAIIFSIVGLIGSAIIVWALKIY